MIRPILGVAIAASLPLSHHRFVTVIATIIAFLHYDTFASGIFGAFSILHKKEEVCYKIYF